MDLNDDDIYIFSECAFPAMAPVIGNKVHIVYQEDFIPGIHEWLEDHDAQENQMNALSYDKDFFVGVGEQYEQTIIKLSDAYPNPAENNVNFVLKLKENASVNISLTNLLGQIVRTNNIGQVQPGANTLSLDVSDLMAGTYFCTIEVDSQKLIRKVIITR